jgi:hypothetical protein
VQLRSKRLFGAAAVFLALSVSPAQARNNPLDRLLPDLGIRLEEQKPLDIEIDGETFRYLMESVFEGTPEIPPSHDPNDNEMAQAKAFNKILQTILPLVKRVHIRGNPDHLSVDIRMHQRLRTDFLDVKDAGWFQLYGLNVPKRFGFRLVYREPLLVLEPAESPSQFVTLRVRLPIFGDKVHVHHVALNPLEAQVEAKAGVIWNILRIKKTFSLYKEKKIRPIAPSEHPAQILGEELKPFLLPFLGTHWEEDKGD